MPDLVEQQAQPLRVLILEDTPTDAELMERELQKAALGFTARRVETETEFTAELEAFVPDVALLDYKLPAYSGAAALAHVRRVHPEVPVVMVTGTLGDNGAIELLKSGAKDYVLKSNLVRLPSAVERVIAVERGIRARKQAEAALRESHRLLATTERIAHIGGWQWDVVRDRVVWSDELYRIFGRRPEEFAPTIAALIEAVHPEDRERVRAAIAASASRAEPVDAEYRIIRPDGTERVVHAMAELDRGPTGAVVAIHGTCLDITERKRAEQELEYANVIVEQSPVVLFRALAREDFPRIYVSRNISRFGYTAEEAKSGAFAFPDYIHAEDKPAALLALDRMMRGDAEIFDIDYRAVIRDGTLRWVHDRTVPIRDDDGEIIAYQGTLIDITERKEVEERVREEEAKFRSLVEQNVAGVVIVRDDGRIGFANGYVAKLTGYAFSEIVGRPLLDIVADAEKVSVAETLRALAMGETGLVQLTSAAKAKDGSSIDVIVSASPTIYESRRAAIGVFIDIRERKQSERALLRLNRALRTLSRGNEVLVHAAREADLLREMCRVVVEAGGYRMAWIGETLHDPEKTVKPIFWAGAEADYLSKVRFSWAEEPSGEGPSGRAIRTGKPQTSQNLATDPSMAPWQAEAKTRGFASTAALPLMNGTEAFGVLTLYAAEPEAFDADELKLLVELATDLAFGLRALRDRAGRASAEQRWRTSLEATVAALATTVEERDPYTAGHQQRVATLAAAIAREMKLPEQQIQGIYLAGVIHDIGKISVPAEILSKPGKLSGLEYQLIQMHPQTGHDIIKGIDFPWPVAEMVLQHHERLDGSGYPRGLKSGAILEEAKILAIADVVESMMSRRPYRDALGIETALAEITKGRGVQYDPRAVDACVAVFREKGLRFQ